MFIHMENVHHDSKGRNISEHAQFMIMPLYKQWTGPPLGRELT